MSDPVTRRPDGSKHYLARSVRINAEVWDRAKRRAAHEGLSMSRVIYLFIQGYGDHKIDAPRMEPVYDRQDGAA